MGRKRKLNEFKRPRMLSSRVEEDLFMEFEKIIKYRDNKTVQDFVNILVDQYVSGSIYLSGSTFHTKIL